MIRLLVLNTSGPPIRLSLLRVTFPTRGSTHRRLASIVRMLDLFPGLNELDEGLGNLTTVDLLEVLQGGLVVCQDLFSIANLDTHHVCSKRWSLCSRLLAGFIKQIVRCTAASNSTGLRPAIQLIGTRVAIAQGSTLERRGACFG